ncbi:MAG: glycosyltransferase [Actinomycetota bacterium]
MLNLVPTPPKALGDYSAVVGSQTVADLRERAERFKGARVLNVSSTAFGGGVAELLYSQIPLLRDLGLDVEWRLLEGHEAFFTVTKAMHNGLQGAEVPWTNEMRDVFFEVNEDNAEALDGDYDFVIIHDPQPAGMLPLLLDKNGAQKGKWIWRCHIDLTARFEPVWKFLGPLIERYDAAIFTMEDFVPADLATPKLFLSTPTIDPLSMKNVSLEPEAVAEVTRTYGIDPLRPMALQVSRFDPWKDPIGVMDAYRLAKEQISGLRLVMIASMAHDDPEGWHYLQVAEAHRAEDPDIFLLSNLQDVGSLAVNAFQRAADVVIQKSIREGFGLTVAEAMWKRKPVIGGNVGGIRLQIVDGETGYLVDTAEQCAERLVELFLDPDRASAMGIAGRARVRERFLTTRNLADFLELFETIAD